jgi:hypothetical protein
MASEALMEECSRYFGLKFPRKKRILKITDKEFEGRCKSGF